MILKSILVKWSIWFQETMALLLWKCWLVDHLGVLMNSIRYKIEIMSLYQTDLQRSRNNGKSKRTQKSVKISIWIRKQFMLLVSFCWCGLHVVSEKVKNSSPEKLSADCWPTVVYHLLRKSSASSRLTVGRMSVICWPSVGWEPLSNTRKASARREEHCISTRKKLSHLSPPYCFGFFKDQSPRNPLCLGILGTKPLTIPSHHPRSQGR